MARIFRSLFTNHVDDGKVCRYVSGCWSGTLSAEKIRVTQFTSDNESGMTALFGDMNGMGVAVVAVGPGQYEHTVERMILTLKEAIRSA